MPAFPSRRHNAGPHPWGADDAEQHQARRGNRRRLLVFAGVFGAAALAGQAWNHLRPDVYRSSLRMQIVLPDAGVAGPGSGVSTAAANQLQTLNSRPLLEKLVAALAAGGQPLGGSTDEAVTRLQDMLQVLPVAGADVVLLQATGPTPALLAQVLNAMPALVRAELVAGQAQAADAHLAGARDELSRLDKTAADRRAQLDRFRGAAGLQAEREENDAVAQSKGLSLALNNAVEKEAIAAARLRAMEDGNAAGRGQSLARDDPTLASLEARASVLREELRDMERTYTPDFMAMDPQARARRARLTELERQIVQQRVAGQQAALQAAQNELAGARSTVERLRGQLAAARPLLRGETARYAQAKALDDDLAQVEKARRDTLERVTRLEADVQRRQPSLTVLEAAVAPTTPWLPDRGQDSVWLLAGALLLGLLAMGLVEIFNRAPRLVPAAAPGLLLPPAWQPGAAQDGASGAAAWPGLSGPPQPPPALAAPVAAPALLQQAEAAALLAAAVGPSRWLCALALLGLTVQELAALRETDVDLPAGRLQVGGAWARSVHLPAWLLASLPQPASERPLLRDAMGQALGESELQTRLTLAALDAGLPQGARVSVDTLRNTCIAWLVSQGLRFSDLPARVGRVDAEHAAALAGPASPMPRRATGEVLALMPALRDPPPA